MLRRTSLAAVLALALCGVVPAAAHADPDCSKVDQKTKVCTVTVNSPGSGGGGSQGPATVDQGVVKCSRADGTEIPCGGPEGSFWYPKESCYAKDVTAAYMPVDAHREFWDSVIESADKDTAQHVALQCVDPAGPPIPLVLPGGLNEFKRRLIDPAVVAQQAVEKMHLHAGEIGITPYADADHIGIIGFPTWMWIKNPGPETTGPQSTTVTAGDTTVTVNAAVTEISWNMGDGVVEHCADAGTPYDDSYGDRPSPSCGHRYQKPGHYTVTATTTWSIKWSGGGQSGTIPLTVTNTVTIVMGEVQVVTETHDR